MPEPESDVDVKVTADSLSADVLAKILLHVAHLESFVHASTVCKGWRIAATPLLHNHGKKGIWYVLCCALDPAAGALHSVKSYWKLHSTLISSSDHGQRQRDLSSPMCMEDVQFMVKFTRQSRFLREYESIPLWLDGAHGQTSKIHSEDETREFHVPGGITSWEVPHELLESLGWSSAADAHRAADQLERLTLVLHRHAPMADGPMDLEHMKYRVEEESRQNFEEVERLQDEEAPVYHAYVSVRAFHVPSQRIADLVTFQPVLRRNGSPAWGRVMFKDERLLFAPLLETHGDIYTRLGIRGDLPYVSITLDEPSDVAIDDDPPNPGRTEEWYSTLWQSSVEGRRWKLSLAIVARPEDHIPAVDDTMMGPAGLEPGELPPTPPANRQRFTETEAMACLQNALNWGK